MKTPTEIKRALMCCDENIEEACAECPYTGASCYDELCKDALTYILQLEERLKVAEIDRKELWGKVLKHGR